MASHRGNSVVITVSDDGHGIDCERIRTKVIAKGLMSKAEASELAERDLIAFIWHPGLSTAETITEISGRGVGMDIVKSRIENLSGTVDVRSVVGQGTTFTIRLPLTLAIMSSLLVRIYDEIYAIPLDHIDEIVEVRPSQIYRVQGRPAIEIRKRIVALVALGDVFRWGGKEHPSVHHHSRSISNSQHSADEPTDKHTVVVVQNGETTIGLLVDQLIGMQEVVLKSLEKNFRTIPGLSGASILGDGRVSLILDLDAVLDLVARQPARLREDDSVDRNDEIGKNDREPRSHRLRNQGTSSMEPILTDAQRHLLRMIFDRGAEGASQALSKWLAEEVHLMISEVELVELEQAADMLGPAGSTRRGVHHGVNRSADWLDSAGF